MTGRVCSIEGCERKHKGHGFCEMHWERWKKTGDPMGMRPGRKRKPCAVDGCDEPSEAKGYCGAHYTRWKRHGDPLGSSDRFGSPAERFWNHVQITPECWLWTGSDNGRGYGSIGTGNKPGEKVYAHRLSYEMHVGPIPDGFHIDHLCKVRNCVNPAHLEAVTPEENNRRSESPSAELARQTHCKRGHLLAGDNLYLQPVKGRPNPSRQCRECRRIRMRANYWRNKESQ